MDLNFDAMDKQELWEFWKSVNSTRPVVEHQNWGTPWTQYFEPDIQDALLAYAQVFYFGE